MKLKKISLLLSTIIGTLGLASCDKNTYSFTYPTEAEDSDVYVEKINGIGNDFIRGMDASSVLSLEKSGVKFYDYNGEEADVFKTLAESGVNCVRLRVWNDPYDSKGRGYGGGNNDLATAIALGKRATKYGMGVCIDFHYSDFWADPSKQYAPKAWENMTVNEKCDALYKYTKKSLKKLINAGVNVTMVQVGNEINYGMSGESLYMNVIKLLKSGTQAVREVNKDIDIILHYTDINKSNDVFRTINYVISEEVDFDTIGFSYYAFWNNDMKGMGDVVKEAKERFNKKIIIAETSYCYTSADGDGCGNSQKGTTDLVKGYPATVQGQASVTRDIIATSFENGGCGVFYWEGCWIPVGSNVEDNKLKWEKYGSGWATSYAGEYDPKDAGKYYGGCSWDNQAMFDFTGHPLPSLKLFKYLEYGTTKESCKYPITI